MRRLKLSESWRDVAPVTGSTVSVKYRRYALFSYSFSMKLRAAAPSPALTSSPSLGWRYRFASLSSPSTTRLKKSLSMSVMRPSLPVAVAESPSVSEPCVLHMAGSRM